MMPFHCENCSTALQPDQQWKKYCSRCYAAMKSALPSRKPTDPALKPDLNSELRDRLDRVTPHRPAPFGSLHELIAFLMSSEARAANAEQSVVRLEKQVAKLQAEIDALKADDDF